MNYLQRDSRSPFGSDALAESSVDDLGFDECGAGEYDSLADASDFGASGKLGAVQSGAGGSHASGERLACQAERGYQVYDMSSARMTSRMHGLRLCSLTVVLTILSTGLHSRVTGDEKRTPALQREQAMTQQARSQPGLASLPTSSGSPWSAASPYLIDASGDSLSRFRQHIQEVALGRSRLHVLAYGRLSDPKLGIGQS